MLTPERFAEGCLALLGSIAFVGIGAVYAGLSFDVLLWLWPVAVPLAFAVLQLPDGAPVRRDLPAALPWSRAELVALGGLAVFGALATTGLNRPDGDDAYYVNAALAHLEHPDLPLLSFDGMHGDPSVPINQVVHRPQVYELGVAWLARLTGIGVRELYWIGLPALWAALIPLAHAVFARALVPRVALLQAAAATGLLLAWGDGHRAFGNWAFVRMFQGKGPLVSVLIVLAVWSALRFTRAPSARAFLLLALCQLAAVGFSSSALVVMPVATGLALLAGVDGRATLLRAGIGLSAVVPSLAVLGKVLVEMRSDPIGEEGHTFGWDALLGDVRGPLALGAFVAAHVLAWAAGDGAWRWVGRYVGWSVLLVVNPFTSALFGSLAALFNWRLLWSVPIPAFVALSVALLLGLPGRARILGASAALGFAAAFTWIGPGTWEDAERVFARPRVEAGPEAAARATLERVGPEDLVLAPFRVAGRLTNHSPRPRLVAVRDLYVLNLTRAWGPEDAEDRMAMLRLVEDRATPAQRRRAQEALPRWCPDLVVALDRERAVRPLEQLGWAVEDRVRGYVLLRPSPGACRGPR